MTVMTNWKEKAAEFANANDRLKAQIELLKIEISNLKHDRDSYMNALWKAVGDDADVAYSYVDSEGGLIYDDRNNKTEDEDEY